MKEAVPQGDGRLFVYGALLDAAHRASLLGRAICGIPARLRGYERRRRRYYYVAPDGGADTEGLVLSGLDSRDFEVLDRYEEVPRLYIRAVKEVETSSGAVLHCWIYLPTQELLLSSE
jgi:gamma-glutamylcyclotransferase (GGCT)/AIG2-like uncharacterized protein YtfP